jgi:hypothetical protein
MRNSNGVQVKRGDFVRYVHSNGVRGSGFVVRTSTKNRTAVIATDDGQWSVPIDAITQNEGSDFTETMPGLLQRGNPAKRKKRSVSKVTSRRKAVPGEFNSPSQATGLPPTKRLVRRRKETAYAPPGIYANPARVSVRAPSMATGEAPTTRLVRRRKATEKAPRGYYANPLECRVEVQKYGSKAWVVQARFPIAKAAKDYARALHRAYPTWTIRVVS